MSYSFNLLSYIRFLSGILALLLVWFLWKKRNSRGAGYLLLFELAAGIWAIADGFEGAATSISIKLIWAQFAYLGVATSAVMFLLFALSYTNQNRFIRTGYVIGLMIIPVFTVLMAITNSFHHLLWTKMLIPIGTNNCIYHYGPYFWINIIYEYTALTLGIVILLTGVFKVLSLYRFQIWVLIVGTILPFLASITYVFKILPVEGLDLTSISFIMSGIMVAISLYWLHLFNIMPIVRKQAIDNLRDGMLVINSDMSIADTNPSFCHIIGMESKSLIGKDASQIFSVFDIRMDQFAPDNDFTVEAHIGEGADLQDFEIKCQMVMDSNHKIIGRIYIFSDITTKKMILDTIAESNNSRRIEIIEKEKLIRDLDAYARSVAHDLKNPISSVINLSDLLITSISENNKDEALEMITMVKEQSEKMIRIVEDLLILSRIRREDIKIIPIEMSYILNEVMNRLHDEITKRNAKFILPERWPKVLGHNQWIEEVWMNLISNALKYGGVPPVIKLGFDRDPDSNYRFWIQDNGDGLPSESLAKIFGDFERLGRKDIPGHGLGLSIVKRVIDKLGGDLRVESSVNRGEGCIFSFTLSEEISNSEKENRFLSI